MIRSPTIPSQWTSWDRGLKILTIPHFQNVPLRQIHKIPKLCGPGDARPTALLIIEDEGLTDKLSGKVFLVTGVSSGLGIDTLRALYIPGADVYGTIRNFAKDHKWESGGKITLIEIELDSFESVRKAANDFLTESHGRLNVLVGNAGVMARPYGLTKDGLEIQFGTDPLGHLLLFHLLLSTLLSSATKTVHLDGYNYE
ncbi:Nn.00g025760.m01.CDS01 [Neocucurbitaria sp. VM-36]